MTGDQISRLVMEQAIASKWTVDVIETTAHPKRNTAEEVMRFADGSIVTITTPIRVAPQT